MATDNIIYFVQRGQDGAVKIGTTTDLKSRLGFLRRLNGNIRLLGIVKGGRMKERILHWCLSDSHLEYEWFFMTPKIEKIIEEYTHFPEHIYSTIGQKETKQMISIRINPKLLRLLKLVSETPNTQYSNKNRTELIELAIQEQFKIYKSNGNQ